MRRAAQIIACDVINPDHINVKFDTIGGLEDIKKALVRARGALFRWCCARGAHARPRAAQYDLVILPLVRPELFERGRLLKPTKVRLRARVGVEATPRASSTDARRARRQGVLLYGPPGTGKTMLAKALAKESNACFINVRAAALQSKWFGDAQKLVTAVFTLAWKIQPCIIFIDEIDSFLGTRKSNEHEAVTSMKTEFMSLWDGFITDNDARVMVLAATNRPWDIDEAILRRLPRAFEVPLPDARQRQRILSVLLRGEDVDETLWADEEEEEGEEGDATEHGVGGGSVLAEIAAATEGYSGSDLQDLCKQAALLPIHDLLEEEESAAASGRPMRRDAPRPLTAEDLFTVLEVRTASCACAAEMKAADSMHVACRAHHPLPLRPRLLISAA